MNSMIIGQTYDLLLKLVVIGDSGVGKTNLLSRFQRDQFSVQSKPTIGVQFATKTVAIENSKLKVQIWDTAGQQRFRAITHAYYKGASGALIVFDLSRQITFQNISKWLKQLKQNAQENIVIILIGNKSDIVQKRAIKIQQIQKFTQQHNLAYLQTSAKQNKNVGQAFYKVIQEIYNVKKTNKLQKDQKSTTTTNNQSNKNIVKNNNQSQQQGVKKNIQLKTIPQKDNQQKRKRKC